MVNQIPWAVDTPDRIPKQRYYDPDFYALEAELFWPRVWQMACRLEEIPKAGDFVEYEILDQSIIVVRVDADTVRAYHNACRHRGVKLVEGNGSLPGARRPHPSSARSTVGAGASTAATPSCCGPRRFAEENMAADDLQLGHGQVRTVGWVRLDQPRQRRPAAARLDGALRLDLRRLEGRIAARRVVAVPVGCR